MDKKITLKQKKFADEYIISGNIYQSMLAAGYSEAYAKSDGCKILENPSVKYYIQERMKELDSCKIADAQEVLEYLTRVLRGEETDEVLRSNGDYSQVVDVLRASTKERLKAAELLGKRYGMWTERIDVESNTKVEIIDDI